MAIHKTNGDFYPVDRDPLLQVAKVSFKQLKDIKGDALIATIPKRKDDDVQFIIPIPTQLNDSTTQLLARLVSTELAYKILFRVGVEMGGYVPPTIGVDIGDGRRAATDVFLMVTADKRFTRQLGQIFIDAEAGHGSAIRRAPDVSRQFVFGASRLPGYSEAKVNIVQVDNGVNSYEFSLDKGVTCHVTKAMKELLNENNGGV